MPAPPETDPAALAGQITACSRSNLALAFCALPPDRRRDMEICYAFCRLVDDLADDPAASSGQKREALAIWRRAIEEPAEGEHPLAPGVRELARRRGIDRRLFHDLLDGVEMDVAGTRFDDADALLVYSYRVAGAVGLASIEIFGYRDPICREYAVALGHALQWTNILRDVGRDWRESRRVYLPRDLMRRHGVDETALGAEVESAGLRALCAEMAGRARAFYAEARRLLPASERRSMLAAEIMRGVYGHLLAIMARDGFRVLARRYRVGAATKGWIILRTHLATRAACFCGRTGAR